MKNHKQMCGLAVAIDYLGDRWTLLIVRELLITPRSFSELQGCLPGCSPNLLVSRLKEMTRNGLVDQRSEDSKKRGLYQLTELGHTLREPVESLVRWGGNLIPIQKSLRDKRPHWLEVAIPALLRPKLKIGSRYKIQFLVDEYEFAIFANDLELDIIRGKAENPEISLKMPYEKLLGLVSGYIPAKALASDEVSSKKYPTKMTAVQRLQEVLA
ncbi:MAG: helix-turn-helix domain-containing protein [Oligoflexia bacterium]|nr:helix-turn-helix domain-containing protein [Oligoflexia bacterium]